MRGRLKFHHAAQLRHHCPAPAPVRPCHRPRGCCTCTRWSPSWYCHHWPCQTRTQSTADSDGDYACFDTDRDELAETVVSAPGRVAIGASVHIKSTSAQRGTMIGLRGLVQAGLLATTGIIGTDAKTFQPINDTHCKVLYS